MSLFFVLAAIWGLAVLCAPFGIWLVKDRLTLLEAQVAELRLQLGKHPARPLPPPAIASMQTAASPPPVPTLQPAAAVTEKQGEEKPPEPAQSFPPSVAAHSYKEWISEKPARTPADSGSAPASPWAATQTPAARHGYEDESPLADWLTSALTGGRLFVTLGLILLFIGVAMLFKYAAHYIEIPIEARFIGVALGAIAMIAVGMRRLSAKRDFGLYMQGGGLGVLFLTVFTAFKFYSLLPSDAAFALLTLIGAATFALSILNDALPLSVLAVTGAFLAPLLTSTRHGNHITLFGYYLAINLIILAIAWVKPWRILTTIGFGFTFAIGLIWGGQYYRPEFYPSVQGFLIAYFLLYTAIGVAFAMRGKPDIATPIDASAIFGAPLIGFGLQLSLVHTFAHGNAISSLVLGGFYGALFLGMRNSSNPGLAFLARVFSALSLLFCTLCIPFTFSDRTTAPLWALESVALLWMLNRTRQRFYGYAGAALLALSDLFMLAASTETTDFNAFYAAAVCVALAHFAASRLLSSARAFTETADGLVMPTSGVGMAWWLMPGFKEVSDMLPPATAPYMPWLLFFAASAGLALLAHRRFAIALFDKPVLCVLPAIIAFTIMEALTVGAASYHPAMHCGFIALPLAFALHYAWLRTSLRGGQDWQHTLAYIAATLLAGAELGYWLYRLQPQEIHRVCGWMLAAAAGVALLAFAEKIRSWPLSALNGSRLIQAGLALSSWLCLLCLYSFTQPATELETAHIPLFNLVELSELAALAALAMLLRGGKLAGEAAELTAWLAAAMAFGFVNSMALRVQSHMLGLPYFSDAMFARQEVQTLLTILWTLIAMTAMVMSSRLHLRIIWSAGAVLLAIVVGKLFLVDLASIGTLSRIISFMGVGSLTLLLGYLAPMPARKET